MKKTVLLTALAFLLMACPASDPYGPATTTIKVFKQGIMLGDTVMKDVKNEKAQKLWPPAKATALKTADLALATIDELKKGKDKKECKAKHADEKSDAYKACIQKYKTDLIGLVKKSVCLTLTALGFIPTKYRSRFQVYIDLGKSFICQKMRTSETESVVPPPRRP